MSINFNIVKKPKKEEKEEIVIEDDDIVEDNEIVDTSSDSKKITITSDPKKKMIRFMGIIVMVVIFIILILALISSCTRKNKTYTYSEIEDILVKAAKSYFKDHSSYLPQDEGDIVEVDYTNLVNEGKMKDLSSYTNDKCSASVKVEKVDNNYSYMPDLNCGDNYSSVLLSDKVLKNNAVTSSGYGLYSINGSYIFRGEEVDNYVSINDSLWRIVKINSNKEIVLVSESGMTYTQPWDDRYNEESLYESGKNIYSASRIKEYLDLVYKATSDDEDDYLITNSMKSKIVSYDVCTGKTNGQKDNSLECSETLKNQKLGLLTLSDYMMASTDSNCTDSSSKSCQNYNYLVIRQNWWVSTGLKNSTTKVFMVSSSGIIKEEYASNYAVVRPVIHLNSEVMYKSGNGTLKKPYKIR